MNSEERKRQWCLFFAWFIALLALIATLYASQVLLLPVCHLCWFQRICIYPLVLILGIAAFRNDGHIAIYTIPLALLGALFALYQTLLQIFPHFSPIDICGMEVSCHDIHMALLGFITYPLLSVLACLLILILLIFAGRFQR